MPVFNTAVSQTDGSKVTSQVVDVAIKTTDIRLELLSKGADRIDGQFPPTTVKRLYKNIAVRIHASFNESCPQNKPWVMIYSSINFSKNKLSFVAVCPEDGELRSYTATLSV